MFELVFLSGVRAGAVVPVTQSMLAGRSTDCQLEVPDPNASRVHCRFEWDGATLTLVDNNSSNGTWLNEERVGTQELKHGHVVRLGESRLRIQSRNRKRHVSDASSSVFNLSGDAADLSNSLSLSLLDASSAQAISESAAGQRLDAILWVSEALSTINDLDELFNPILETLFAVFPQADRGFLLLGDEFDSLERKAMRTRDAGATEGLTVSASLCKASLERKAVLVYSEDKAADFDQGMSLVDLKIRSAMVVPLLVKEEVFGLLVIDTPDRMRPFTEDDMGLAAAVCRQVAVALKNALLLREVERETKTRTNLQRFLPKQVVDQAVAGELDLALGGSTCHGTVAFFDIIGFTRMSETMDPQAVVTMMNRLFNHVVPVLEQEGGAIDKFMGDCVMGLWGIPFDSGRSSLEAVTAGLLAQTAMAGFNYENRDKLPNLQMGVGMSSGQLVAGNIGTMDRLEYTVLGNTVNTASRVQGMATGDQVLVTSELREPLGDNCFAIPLPSVLVKNKAEPVAVFSVRGVITTSGEILLHLPVQVGSHQAWLIRRLTDGNFVLLHEPDAALDGEDVETRIPEYRALNLGTVAVLALLPAQQGESGLRRSLVSLADKELGGLLSQEPPVCPLTWEEMRRGTGG